MCAAKPGRAGPSAALIAPWHTKLRQAAAIVPRRLNLRIGLWAYSDSVG